jgi:hypothetical protein
LIDENREDVFTATRVQAFDTVDGIEVFKMNSGEMGQYAQQSGRVDMVLTVNLRRLPTDYSSNFLKCFSKLHQNGDFSDMNLVCSGHTFRCHKVILAVRAEVFANMLKGDFREAK